jgi:hypothetical protein
LHLSHLDEIAKLTDNDSYAKSRLYEEGSFMDATEIKDVIRLYFDGCYEGSFEKIDRVFHAAAHIYGHKADGTLQDWPRDDFVGRVGSPRPVDRPSFPKEEEIISVDFTGDTTAVAKVRFRLGTTMFTDILCFIFIDGKWSVISKLFHGVQV